MSKDEKLKKLKVEVERLGERAQRKQEISKLRPNDADNDSDLDMLLSSIKAKIGIMHLYKQ